MALDALGNECATGLLTRDGMHLLTKGCVAFVHLDGNGNQIERRELPEVVNNPESARGGRSAGRPARYRALPVAPEVILAHVVMRVDALLADAGGDGGLVMEMPEGCFQLYAVGASCSESTFLVVNDSGLFLLHGEDCGLEFTGPEDVAPMSDANEDAAEFDFDDEDFS